MSITNNNAVAKVAAAVAGAGLVLSSFAFVAPAQADTTSDLQAQINALLAEIASLQSQLGGGSTSTGAQFTRDLTIGATGADVTQLQTWLISKGYSIPAGATGYFGAQTQAALAAFQAANGITPAAGYFGPITRAKVNAMLSTGGTTGGGDTGGTTLSGGEATLSNFNLTSGDTVAEGDTNIEIASAKFDVDGGDVNVGRVKVEMQGDDSGSNNPWLYFDRLYVYDGDTKVGSVDVGTRDAWDSNNTDTSMNSSGAEDYTVDISTNDVVKEGDTAELSIRADAQNTIDTNNEDETFTVRIPDNGIRAVDPKGIQQYTGDDSDTVTVDFNGNTSGKLTVSEASDDPDAGVLVADDNQSTNDLSVFNFNLKNTEDGDALIDSVKVRVATTSSDTTDDPGLGDIIRKATLSIAGHDYDGDVNNDGTITFDLNNDNVVVKGNDSEEGMVTIDLASQSGHYAASGESLTFSIIGTSDVSAEGLQNGENTTVTGTANGNKQSIALNGGISVAGNDTNVDVHTNDTDSTKSYGTFTIKFDVTAVGDDVYVPKSISSTTAASSTYTGVVINMSMNAAAAGTSSESLTATADVVTVNGNSFYTVHAGDTETFTATVTLDPSAAGDYEMGLDNVKFTTDDSSLNNLQTLDVDENDNQFHTDIGHIIN